MKKIYLILVIILLHNLSISLAQPGTLDPTFYCNNSPSNAFYTIQIQSDNKIIVGGVLTYIGGLYTGSLSRLLSNGDLDTTYHSPIVPFAFSSSLQPDGKLFASAPFNNNICVRLDIFGNVDTTFNPSGGVLLNDDVLVQPDFKLLIGGGFTTYNGYSRNRLIRLNNNGSIDLTFDPHTGFNAQVTALALQSDGKILVGGDFTTFNGVFRSHITRLDSDGSLDTAFNPGQGISNYGISYPKINCISIQTDGKIIVGGNFDLYDSIPVHGLCRLNTNGSIDTSFIRQGYFTGPDGDEVRALGILYVFRINWTFSGRI